MEKMLNLLLDDAGSSKEKGRSTRYKMADEFDETELVIDSPDQEPMEDEDLPEPDHLDLSTRLAVKDKDANREQFLTYPDSLPYPCESIQEMDDQLDRIIQRISQAVQARDYDIGFLQWNHRLECWISLKYPMKRHIRAKLAKLYYELSVLPGMDPRLVEASANMCMSLLSNKKKLDISDLQLPWEPLYTALERELFPKKRKTGITGISVTFLTLTEFCQRFFSPHETFRMLETFLPRLDGSSLNSVLATQSFMAHFLPQSHPTEWLDPAFVLWEAFSNSQIYTEQWLDVMANLAEKHVDPSVSDPKLVEKYRRTAPKRRETFSSAVSPPPQQQEPSREGTPAPSIDAHADSEMTDPSSTAPSSASKPSTVNGSAPSAPKWRGIRRDVGIFTYEQWDFMMLRMLRAMAIPVGNVRKSGNHFISQHGGEMASANADAAANATTMKMTKPTEKLHSLAVLLVYSMAEDSPVLDRTPAGSKQPSRRPSVHEGLSTLSAAATTNGAASPSSTAPARKAYVGGSRALDSLSKFINATETFFHPSNYGHWSPMLSRFLQNILWEFTKRWTEEEKGDCKTPKEWRLTKKIRREFVAMTRQVALLAMFSKDPMSMGSAQSALKSMAFLEPSLVLPAVLERSFPALEGLLETHRTTACIGALAAVALPLVSRTNYPAGSKHILPLLDLCIPGLDVNDPLKTLSTVAFIIQSLTTVKIADLTTREALDDDEHDGGSGSRGVAAMDGVQEGTPPPTIEVSDEFDDTSVPVLSREEEDQLTRESTADFPEWISKFFRAVLALYDHLPEPGRSGRAGGKLEETMISTITVACDFVLGQSSPEIYDVALKIFTKHVVGSPKINSAKAIGHLAACFGRADPKKALEAFVPVCIANIKLELENGASSTRTTSSSTPIESDTAFHWYCILLLGSLHMAAEESLRYKTELLDLMNLMRDKCLSERGYTYVGRVLQALLGSLTSIWPREGRSASPSNWASPEYQKRPHSHWGELHTAGEVTLSWHTPTEEEVNFALEALESVAGPALDKLEELVKDPNSVTKEWRNDFNRYNNLVRNGLAGVASLTVVQPPQELGQQLTDVGDEDMAFIADFPRCKYGAYLDDPNDPRLQKLTNLHNRVKKMLHQAMQRLIRVDDKSEDAIDSIKMALSASKHTLLSHPMDRTAYASVKANFTFVRDLSKFTTNQKKYPRLIWVRRASLYHASRLRLNTFYRQRSTHDDALIRDIAELCMSKYVSVRKAAQRALAPITNLYDGTRTLLLDTFFDAIRPGNDPDRMKGALYVLGSKSFGNMAILDWNVGPKYILKLLGCQFEQKPSIQTLVRTVTGDFLIRLAEPSTIKLSISSPASQEAALVVEEASAQPKDEEQVQRLSAHNQSRIDSRNTAYAQLLPELLRVARDSNSHWRYTLTATRFLRSLIRRDQPLPPETCEYLTSQVVSELPNQRATALVALTKILHFIKLRTFCDSDEKLLLQKSENPFKRITHVPEGIDSSYTDKFLNMYKEPLTTDSILVDKSNTGWLVWGKSYESYIVPAEEVHAWDSTSQEALDKMRAQIVSKPFWESLLKNFAQEQSRDYLALDNTTIVKSIFQIFRDEPLDIVRELVTEMMTDNDRHKQRASAEVIGGIMRGAKHWPLSMQKKVHDWLAPMWQKIFDSINLDTQPSWEMMVEYVLGDRDPRRNESLMGFLTSLSVDVESSEAFKEARKGYLVGATMKSLSWHFTPWAPDFADSFWGAITSPYTEMRLAISDNLRYLNEMRLHPSFPSTEAFLSACQSKNGMALLVSVDDEYIRRIGSLVKSLADYRAIRQPFAKDAVQPYDSACLTILTWLWMVVNDFRVTTVYPFVERLLPELMHMQDIQDNQELQKWAQVVLAAMAALPYPASMVPSVLDSLLDLFKSPSWRTRLAVLPLLQVFFFHQLYALSEEQITKVLDTLYGLLKDNHIEVREAAATTLSGVVRCSQRDSVLELKDRFMKAIRKTKAPGKKDITATDQEAFQTALLDAHAAVLGASALILAWPYEVPAWLPELLLATANKFSTSRAPVSTTVKDLLAQFRKTHQDTWADDQKKFSSEQLQDLNDLVIGTSYYA